jgi:enterochelin esterase-like enzyme
VNRTIAALVADPSLPAAAAALREAHERGGPLIEPLPGIVDRRGVPCSQVTFLYEAPEAASVSILTSLNDTHPHEAMERVPGTDLWWAVRTAADDVRVTYQFCGDDPFLGSNFFELPAETVMRMDAERLPRTAADPTNPARTRAHGGMWDTPPEHWHSVLTLPRTPPDPWHEPRPEAPAGSVHSDPMRSRILGNERQVSVYTPPGYRPDGGPYPLVVLLDGFDFHRIVDAPTIVDNLVADHRIAAPVLAMVENATKLSRFDEYMCNASFADCLADELLPWVRARYEAVTAEADSVIVGGVSAGGLAAAHAAWSRPDAFGVVLSMSGAFPFAPAGDAEDEWLARQIAATEPRPVRWWMNVGVLERHPDADEQVTMIGANRHLNTVLGAKGYDTRYSEYSGGHEWLNWQATLPNALQDLLGA